MTLSNENNAALISGLQHLGLEFNTEVIARLVKYVVLLKKWNKAYNLISRHTEVQIIPRHILDSLSISRFIQGDRVIDVGTGPGLPGLLLAITQPEKEFTLLDSNGKKTRFLIHAVNDLGLKNVTVEKQRVETYYPDQCFDVVVTRAFSSLKLMMELCGHLTGDQGVFVAMKGGVDSEDLALVSADYKVQAVERLIIPELDEDRHAVIIRNTRLSSTSQ